MVRKRGGASGQGGGKRAATSPPIGATYKDSRRNIQGDEDFDDEDVVIYNKQKSTEKSIVEKINQSTIEKINVNQQSRQSKSGSVIDMLNERASVRGSVAGSIRGAAARDENKKRKDTLGMESLYKTPAPDGCMRDVITVEVETKDRENYRGTVTYEEAKYKIFLEALDLPEELLHGVKIQFGEGPTISYKLTEQIDVDTLAGSEFFEFERKIEMGNKTRSEFLGCRIKGLRARRNVERQADDEEEPESNLHVVTISGCDYSVEEDEMKEWLSQYGEVFGSITENTHLDEKPHAKPTGNGTYSAKVRLDRPIPQFLPMYGKKVRVDHKGQQIMCTHCYGKHHRKVCRSERVEWMDYVVQFMRNNQNVTNGMIGRWFDIAKKERRVPKGNENGKEQRAQGSENTQRFRHAQPMAEDNYIDHKQLHNTHSTTQKEVQVEKSTPTTKAKPQPSGKYRTTCPEKLKMIVDLRDELENPERMSRLCELTELGLSVEAAREMHDNEKEIEKINKLLRDKKKKEQMGKKPKEQQAKDGDVDQAFEW